MSQSAKHAEETIRSFKSKLQGNLPSLIDAAFAVGLTGWLILLIRTPWNLYFMSRKAKNELLESEKRNINVDPQDKKDVLFLEKRLLATAVGSHVVSAAAVYLVASITEEKFVRKQTSFLFLGSALLRPVVEAHRYLRERIATLIQRVQYPREDVYELRQKIQDHEYKLEELKEKIKSVEETIQKNKKENGDSIVSVRNTIRTEINGVEDRLQSKLQHHTSYIDGVARSVTNKMTESITQISKDQQMIEGMKLFVKNVLRAEEK